MSTWKPTPIQAKHIAVNRAFIAAGWQQCNSRAGVANSIFAGGQSVTFRFGEEWRQAIVNGEAAPKCEMPA